MDTPPSGIRRTLAIGELLWDLLPAGPRLGGAPFNVVAHLSRLGHAASILTAVGRDELGHDARQAVSGTGVDAGWIQESPDLPTGTARVTLGPDGSPVFEIVRPAAYDGLRLADADADDLAATGFDGIVLGTLAQQVPAIRAASRTLVERTPAAERLYDVNLREGCWDVETIVATLALATIVKLSEDEAQTLAAALDLPDPGGVSFLDALARRSGARAVCLTRGSAGAVLFVDGEVLATTPPRVQVVDTVGAGDAFAAGLLDGMRAGRPAA